jgi:hypothetical protein
MMRGMFGIDGFYEINYYPSLSGLVIYLLDLSLYVGLHPTL